ncbi:MAG: hypothetical protein ACFFA0_16005 [Promethearchaeota archaeon]
MKEKDNNKNNIINEGSSDRISFVPSNNLDFLINKLSNPNFLGSFHLKKEINPNYHQVENILGNEHDLKLTRSLKNTIFNPITKILIISAIIFNIIWFLSRYL